MGTSSSSRRISAAAASLAVLSVLCAALQIAPVAGAAPPVGYHVSSAPVKTGEAISVNVTVERYNTEILDVVVRWWTSLSETMNSAYLTQTANESVWSGEIPGQPRPCDVYYRIWIEYRAPNAVGSISTDTVYLPGESQNYLVAVKGDLFEGYSLAGIAIGIGLLALALAIILYAQRLGPKWDPRYEESVKASKEKVEIPGDGDGKGSEPAEKEPKDGRT